jgi:hypothetical protein
MNVTKLNSDLNELVSKGDMIMAINNFFADNSVTVDHTGVTVSNKAQHLAKMEGFLGGIAKVNGITKHAELAGENISFSEYTFDFDMKDGSKILWHEILLRNWQDGKVIKESYFKL